MQVYNPGNALDAIIKRITESPSKCICFTHRRDLDGLGSAAMLVHYLKLPISNVFFSDHENAEMERALATIKEAGIWNGVAIFVDLPINPSMDDIVGSIIGFLRETGNLVVWLDHHRLADSSEGVVRGCDFTICGEGDECGTELVYDNLVRREDGYGKELARIAHISDFYVLGTGYSGVVTNIGGAITYANYTPYNDGELRNIVVDMANGDYSSRSIMRGSENYDREAKENIKIFRDTVTVHEVGKLRIGIGSGFHIDATDACRGVIIKEFGCDIGVMINTKEGKVNFRSNSDRVDTSLLARSLGGGGHPQASGATPRGFDASTKEGIENMRKRILEKAEEAYGQVYISGQ